jgi:hypothetical protein
MVLRCCAELWFWWGPGKSESFARVSHSPVRYVTRTEEQTIVRYILDLGLRGFAPRLCEVADMANRLLGVRGGELVGKHWAERFVTRSNKFKMAFNRVKDRQRILQEDPEIISAWFKLVEDTKAKYGVHDNDMHNFDETGFQMGVIGSMKVVTGAVSLAALRA